MEHVNILAEMARHGYNKRTLCAELNKRGIKISYDKLCRQLRGESEISVKEAFTLSDILHSKVEVLFNL